jgi:curli production assembly/transport component CsgG
MDCLQVRASRQTGRSALLGPKGAWLAVAIMLAGCGTPTTVPPSNARTDARLSPSTGVTRDLMRLPEPKARIPVAVYAFRDQTGQFKSAPDSLNSTLVTQGAASILVKALQDSGWYIPVEREGLQNLLTERRIVRAIETPNERGRPQVNLPNMQPASLIIEGGVVAYESNVRTGGKGANYRGIGASTQYRVDQVTVSLRSVDVRTGQIINAVSVTKTLYSFQFAANVYKFVSFQSLLQGETGYTRNEPAQLAVREAIEAAIIHMTAMGIRDRHFELQDPGAWDHPVIQAALLEGLSVQGRDAPEDDMPVRLLPLNPRREPVVPIAVNSEETLPERPAPPRVQPATPPRAAPPVSAAPGAPPGVSTPTARPTPAAVPAPAAVPTPAAVPAPQVLPTSPVVPAAPAVRAAPPAPAAPVAPASPTPQAAPGEPPKPLPPAVERRPAAVPSGPKAAVPAASAASAANGKTGDIFNQYWNRR